MMTIEIRVFKGEAITLNEDGSFKNENQYIKFSEVEFEKYLKYIKAQGFCKAEVTSVFKTTKTESGFEKHDLPNEFKEKYAKQLKQAFRPDVVVQPSMADIMRRMELLEAENKELKGNSVAAPIPAPSTYNKALNNYNKDELIELGLTMGIEFNEAHTRNDMLSAIKVEKAKNKK